MKLPQEWVFPDYSQDNFANIPSTILKIFGINSDKPTLANEIFGKYVGAKNVILLLIDALGYKHWPLFSKFPAHQISAVFPSTTANALNCISSGLLPSEHGLFEWTLYLQEFGKSINTLPFTDVFTNKLLKKEDGFNPQVLFNAETIYEKLKRRGVNSYSFVSRLYARSNYSELIRAGSEMVPFVNFSDLAVNLRTAVNHATGRNYFFVYWDMLDTLGHVYGPSSEAWQTELKSLFFLWQKETLEKVNKDVARKTLVLVTADHGQIDVVPEKTIFLTDDTKLMDTFAKDKNGKPILPTGGPRDAFLHLQKGKVEEIYRYLQEKLTAQVEIYKTEDLIKNGFFGRGEMSLKFRNRLGNLLILPRGNQMIWRKIKDEKSTKRGHHGGLTKEEMLIPFSTGFLNEYLT